MKKNPHIIELSAFILNMFVFMFLFLINFLTSLGMYSTSKKSNTYKATQCVPTSAYSSRFTTYAPFFIVLGRLSLE